MSVFEQTSINSLIDQSLETLKKDRDREVLRRRNGINLEAQTLEEIGKDLGITRERVRQIEKAALIKLRDRADHSHDFAKQVATSLNKKGGILSLNGLKNALTISDSIEPHVIFLLKINPTVVCTEKNDQYGQVIAKADLYDEAKLNKLHGQIVEIIKSQSKPSKFAAIQKQIDGPHKADSLMELASASNTIAELDGLWGLAVWPEVNPKSIRDKIYLILKKTGRPLHFTDISQKISTLSANPKKVTTQAVHNELIKDKRFVLIGRGIYALGEWGYRSGTVADIIEEILREENGPLSKDEIVKRVLSRRQVKTTTIVLNLQEKPQFKRVDKGIYALAS